MHPVAMPSLVSCCLLQRFKFHTQRLLLSGWLLTNVQVNITTTLHDTRHTCIYITLVLLFISSLFTSSIFLGRLAVLNSLLLPQFLWLQDRRIIIFAGRLLSLAMFYFSSRVAGLQSSFLSQYMSEEISSHQ
jgi:hypothetical protein